MNLEYSELFQSLATVIIICDEEFQVVEANQSACEWLTIGQKRIRRSNIKHLLPSLEDYLRDHIWGCRRVNDIQIDLPDGRQLEFDCSISNFEQGRLQGWSLEIRPLEAHKLVMAEEKQAKQMQVSQQLTKSLAHEIKNPLAGMSGAIQLLKRQIKNRIDSEEYLSVVEGGISRLSNLVDRMLGPKQAINLQIDDIHLCIDAVAQLLMNEKEPAINLTLDFDVSLPPFLMDKDLLFQALLNIGKNALQALDGQGNLTFKTRLESHFMIHEQTHGRVLALSIINDGKVIPAEYMETLFLPMMTTKVNGFGIGLSITQNIVHQHMGLLAVKSKPGKTEFTCYLPIRANE